MKLKKEARGVLDALACSGYNIEVINPDGVYVYVSENCDYDTLTPSQMVGKHIYKAYGGMDQHSVLLEVIETGIPQTDIVLQYMSKKDTRPYNWLYSAFPIFDSGTLIGVVAIYRQVDLLRDKIESIGPLLADELACCCSSEKIDGRSIPVNMNLKKFGDVIYGCPEMQRVIERAKRVADSDQPLLLVGESGCGKGVLAQAIHTYRYSSPSSRFITVNCATIPEDSLESVMFGVAKDTYASSMDKKGLFDEAKNGTIFLEDIHYLSLRMQAKLLRAIESKKIRRLGAVNEISTNTRVIIGVGSEPLRAIGEGKLLDDLYYRLTGGLLELPPLRERGGDVELLTNYFIRNTAKESGRQIEGITLDVMEFFNGYAWPGNIRELSQAIKYAAYEVGKSEYLISKSALAPYLMNIMTDSAEVKFEDALIGLSYKEAATQANEKWMKAFNQKYISAIFEEQEGSMSKTAKRMGISRQHLYELVKRYGVVL